MERKIGEIFEYNGEWYQAVKPQGKCCSCDLSVDGHCASDFSLNGSCFYCHRKDGKDVMFKKPEKAGEPIIAKGRTFQRFIGFGISCEGCVFNTGKSPCGKRHYIEGSCLGREIWVEIKQNEKDMEEKKLNLKPFDLQKAREGKPVCTRDGKKARIICFDLKNEDNTIVAAVGNDSFENLFCYTKNGKLTDGIESDKDLMMLSEKKEGWVNVYNDAPIYDTKERAELAASTVKKRIGTFKISWEE